MASPKSTPPRASRADRPPLTTHHSSHNFSTHPPRASERYMSLRMAFPPGLDASKRPSSPIPNQVHTSLSPRPSQRRGSKSSIGSDRPPTPVSKSSTKNSQSGAQPATQSILLQEKLQEERKNEIQRNLTRLAGEMGVANESRAAPATPARSATGDGTRPQVTDDVGDGPIKGLALKEMGQVMLFPPYRRDV